VNNFYVINEIYTNTGIVRRQLLFTHRQQSGPLITFLIAEMKTKNPAGARFFLQLFAAGDRKHTALRQQRNYTLYRPVAQFLHIIIRIKYGSMAQKQPIITVYKYSIHIY
jgi:hypothetical protein